MPLLTATVATMHALDEQGVLARDVEAFEARVRQLLLGRRASGRASPADRAGEVARAMPAHEAARRLAEARQGLRDHLAIASARISPLAGALVLDAVDLQVRASTLGLEARIDALQAQLRQALASQSPAPADGARRHRRIELLSAAQIGEQLDLTEATVYQRERKRQLFGFLPGQRRRGRVYPSFQLWPELGSATLERILRILGDKPSERDATFFAAINVDLLGCTPVEVLIGEWLTDRDDEGTDEGGDDVMRLLALAPALRLEAVVAAARKFTIART